MEINDGDLHMITTNEQIFLELHCNPTQTHESDSQDRVQSLAPAIKKRKATAKKKRHGGRHHHRVIEVVQPGDARFIEPGTIAGHDYGTMELHAGNRTVERLLEKYSNQTLRSAVPFRHYDHQYAKIGPPPLGEEDESVVCPIPGLEEIQRRIEQRKGSLEAREQERQPGPNQSREVVVSVVRVPRDANQSKVRVASEKFPNIMMENTDETRRHKREPRPNQPDVEVVSMVEGSLDTNQPKEEVANEDLGTMLTNNVVQKVRAEKKLRALEKENLQLLIHIERLQAGYRDLKADHETLKNELEEITRKCTFVFSPNDPALGLNSADPCLNKETETPVVGYREGTILEHCLLKKKTLNSDIVPFGTEITLGGDEDNIVDVPMIFHDEISDIELVSHLNNIHRNSNGDTPNDVSMDKGKPNEVSRERSKNPYISFDLSPLEKSDSIVELYTGVPTFKRLKMIFNIVTHERHHSNQMKLSSFEEFLIVMVRLRLNMFEKDLASRFCVSQGTISRVISQWLPQMSARLRPYVARPEEDTENNISSTGLQSTFRKDATIIIDCFEVLTRNTQEMISRGEIISQSKERACIKFLVGFTPFGIVSFISQAWPGGTSDVEIVEKSGFLDTLKEDDVVIADQALDIREFTSAQIEIPIHGQIKAYMNHGDYLSNWKLMNAKVYAERMMEKLRRRFRILRGPYLPDIVAVNSKGDALIDHVFLVCCAVNNLCLQDNIT